MKLNFFHYNIDLDQNEVHSVNSQGLNYILRPKSSNSVKTNLTPQAYCVKSFLCFYNRFIYDFLVTLTQFLIQMIKPYTLPETAC